MPCFALAKLFIWYQRVANSTLKLGAFKWWRLICGNLGLRIGKRVQLEFHQYDLESILHHHTRLLWLRFFSYRTT